MTNQVDFFVLPTTADCINACPSLKHTRLKLLHLVSYFVKSWQSMVSYVGPSLLQLSRVIIFCQTAKLVSIKENLLYTRENHFYWFVSTSSRMCMHDHTHQATRFFGVGLSFTPPNRQTLKLRVRVMSGSRSA